MANSGQLFVIATLAMAACLAGAPACAQEAEQFSGIASFYSADYSGATADGELYDAKQFTAAHRTLPFGTLLRVTDLSNERSVTVVVTDRGPFVGDRVLDLSMAAANALDMVGRGIIQVTAIVQHPRAIHLRELLAGD